MVKRLTTKLLQWKLSSLDWPTLHFYCKPCTGHHAFDHVHGVMRVNKISFMEQAKLAWI